MGSRPEGEPAWDGWAEPRPACKPLAAALGVREDGDTAWAAAAVEYAAKCALFEGTILNCWINKGYAGTALSPACKRYLQKGFAEAHLGAWRRFYPPESVLVLTSAELFADAAGTTRKVEAFLGLEPMAASTTVQKRASAQTCWHNCKVEKKPYAENGALPADLEAALRELYDISRDR